MKKLSYVFILLLLINCGKDDNTPEKNEIPIFKIVVTEGDGGSVNNIGGEYREGTNITIEATPEQGYEFSEWLGVNSSENPLNITVSENLEITAQFTKVKHSLTVNVVGSGVVEEEIISSSKTSDYDYGSVVRLNAIPLDEWIFVEWDGISDNQKNPVDIEITSTNNVTATFQPIIVEALIGNWDVNSDEGINSDSKKTISNCAIFGITFIDNFNFIIHTSSGTVSGTYAFLDSNTINLGSIGQITNLIIENDNASFNIEINNCQLILEATKIESSEEITTTFLEKTSDKPYWKEINGEGEILKYLEFKSQIINGNIKILDLYFFNSQRSCMNIIPSSQISAINDNFGNSLELFYSEYFESFDTYLKFTLQDDTIELEEIQGGVSKVTILTEVDEEDFNSIKSSDICPELIEIQDANFEKALIELGIDDESDGFVIRDSIKTIDTLRVDNSNIGSLKGIEYFESLVFLDARKNQINEIDLSENLLLDYLILFDNNIAQIDLLKNLNLKYLLLQRNQIQSIDLSNNIELIQIGLGTNNLASIDLSTNINLEVLSLNINPIQSLDLSNNAKISNLLLQNTSLSSIDLSNLTNLVYLTIDYNPSLTCIQINNQQYENINASPLSWLKDNTAKYSVICPLENIIPALNGYDMGDAFYFINKFFTVTAKYGGSTALEGVFEGITYKTVRFSSEPDDTNSIWIEFNYSEENNEFLYAQVGKREEDVNNNVTWTHTRWFNAPGYYDGTNIYILNFNDFLDLWNALVDHVEFVMDDN